MCPEGLEDSYRFISMLFCFTSFAVTVEFLISFYVHKQKCTLKCRIKVAGLILVNFNDNNILQRTVPK